MSYSPQKEIVKIIKEAKGTPLSNEALGQKATELLAHLASLAGRKAVLKQQVAQKEAQFIKEGMAVNRSEIEAEASDEYVAYKYAESIWELGLEGIKLFKKLLDDKEDEYNRS